MSAAASLSDLLDGRPVREVEPGIFSVLPADAPGQRYDGRARMYDRVIGSRLYNRLAWGTSPEDYRAFAGRAVASSASGWLLDAGCGTLLATAGAYAAAPDRPVVAVDQSLDMLRRGRERLAQAAGTPSGHVVFLQADLLDLPFRAGCFQTVLSMGMLHLFDTLEPLLASLRGCLVPDGQLYLTSLVENGRVGDRYMRFLHRAGELANPRTAAELQRVLEQALGPGGTWSVRGNMAFASFGR
ncbi:MAG TPA: class I SAM-dependent methyltransferase [Longimicrobium sp.]|nr:class I SAM-dependent methyltransferase [Longimicrobium sp.]